MKSIFAAVMLALGLLTGCTRQPPAPAPDKNIEEAKRRNETLRQLKQTREESARRQDIIAADRRVKKLHDARRQAKIDREKLSGRWEATAVTLDGREVSAAELKEKPWSWVVDDQKSLLKQPGSDGKTIQEEEIDIVIDPSTSPKTIDLTNRAKKETNKGIYDIEGDTLKICFAMHPRGERPGDFMSRKDGKQALIVWKRIKG